MRLHLEACERVEDPQPLQAGVSCSRTILPLSSRCLSVSGGRCSESRAPGALTRGKGRQERRGLQAGLERSLRPREGLLSGGRAPESGGRRFPLPVRGGDWPLLPPPPPPLPPLSKINSAVAGAAAAGDPAVKSLGRGLASTASAPRTAQRLPHRT